MGTKGEQACRFAVWTCSELAAFLSPSFLCILSLLLSDGLLLAQFLSGFSPPAFRYKSLPGCYTSAVFFFLLSVGKFLSTAPEFSHSPPACGRFVDSSVKALTFPLVFLDFFSNQSVLTQSQRGHNQFTQLGKEEGVLPPPPPRLSHSYQSQYFFI